ncbi:MAG: hypothetical protein J2O44_05715, partial [Porphyrobacter sp.]|nr:hypothetical protein [Porphyrobacter sp.]
EKSIIHRLRSLSMSDVSPSRRRLGRWLLAGGALALPLTASVSYAAAAQDRGVEAIGVAPSDAPPAPDAPKVERHVQTFVLKRDGDQAHADADGRRFERHRFVVETDGPLSEAQKKHFEQMRREWEKKGAEWQARAGEWQKMAKQQQSFALAFADTAPEVSADCDKTEGSASRSWTDDSGKQHVVLCERVIREQARMGEQQALMGQQHALMSLRMARNAVANNAEISDSVRQEVLADLDKELARLEAEHK